MAFDDGNSESEEVAPDAGPVNVDETNPEEVKRPPNFVPYGEARRIIDRDEVYVH
jgi:hypothetical protein